jgi:Dyp-type peroxidase family
MPALELDDIQGLLIRGYSRLPASCFVLLGITDGRAAKQWIAGLLRSGAITPGDRRPGHEGEEDVALNLAISWPGLQTLGLDPATLESFPRELKEGMTGAPRPRTLGDHGESAPERWRWGGPAQPPVHVLLLLYAVSDQRLAARLEQLRLGFGGGGVTELLVLETHALEYRKEHFGFHDGLSQPRIAGLGKAASAANTVEPGEFIMGYRNQYGFFPDSPESGGRDLGVNGSYLVFRQLSQDVHGFWKFLDAKARQNGGPADPGLRLELAAKMIGRWPSGAPLAVAPSHEDAKLEDLNDFGYAGTDPFGERCPIGSHVRRSNPRDSMAPGPEESLTVANRHRILRRGRMFGAPLDPGFDIETMLQGDDGQERGTHFICLNTDIARQFEFIQQSWINNPKFEGLYADADPIMGDHDPRDEGSTGTFTVQGCPVRRRVQGLPRFVQVRGGGYFFFPGLKALGYLAGA